MTPPRKQPLNVCESAWHGSLRMVRSPVVTAAEKERRGSAGYRTSRVAVNDALPWTAGLDTGMRKVAATRLRRRSPTWRDDFGFSSGTTTGGRYNQNAEN